MNELEKGYEYIRLSKHQANWKMAFIHFHHHAVSQVTKNQTEALARDLDFLDVFGEAAFRAAVPEALCSFQNLYKNSEIAVHMARAFFMIGDRDSCREYLAISKESSIKAAVHALCEVTDDIKQSQKGFLDCLEKYKDFYYPDFFGTLAVVADAIDRKDLVQWAELKSKETSYDNALIHFNQSLRLMSIGDYPAAWRLYEHRLNPASSNPPRTELGPIPLWEGESLFVNPSGKKKTLLIYLEQGIGDGIFSLRYVDDYLRSNQPIEVMAHKPLLNLVRKAFPEVTLYDEADFHKYEDWEKHQGPYPDFWVHAMSIPYKSNRPEPINTGAYLKLNSSAVNKQRKLIQERILDLKQTKPSQQLPVVVINWHGRIDTVSDRTRAFSVDEFIQESCITKTPHLVISVQLDATKDEIKNLKNKIEASGGFFINAAEEIEDLVDTALWIQCSDQLITCDTSVAHLGGALGHPTTVLVRNLAIWQWSVKRPRADGTDQSVWYDSVTIRPSLAPDISWLVNITNKLNKGKLNHANHQL